MGAWAIDQQARKIPTSYHQFTENGDTTQLPYLKPSDVLSQLFTEFPWLLLGGLNPGAAANKLLGSFWRQYRLEHSSHAVFQRAARNEVQLEYVIPLVMHGDGGRTLKKQPLECVSIQAVLGLNTLEPGQACSCCQAYTYGGGLDFSDPMMQRLNAKNNSYLTHFLLCAFASKRFPNFPGLLMSILGGIAEDLAEICEAGIEYGGSRYWFALLGYKSDLEYAAKTGLLSRSYQNVGHKNEIECCHQCGAGGQQVPFEDFGVRARWKSTVFRSPPWTQLPPFASLSFEPWLSGRAAMWFRHDLFHIFRLGCARNFCASAILLLAYENYFDSDGDSHSLDARLKRAWSNFYLWSCAEGVTTSGIRSFSKQKMHRNTESSFPYLGCKGSDTILFLRWLRWLTALHRLSAPPASSGWVVLNLVWQGCNAGLMLQKVHSHGLWLKRSCNVSASKSAQAFLASYARLAHLSLQKNLFLFGMVPKLHSLAHVVHDLQSSEAQEHSLNPAVFDTSTSEDFIGRVSRQSRRVSYRNHTHNTLLAYKIKANLVIKRFKNARGL